MEKTAIFSGLIGVIGFVLTIVVTVALSWGYVPFILGLFFMIIMVAWKPLFNMLAASKAVVGLQSLEGVEKLNKITAIVESHEGGRTIHDGAPKYVKVLCEYLLEEGFSGLHNYRPKNFMVFEPYGIFMMEVEESPQWNRPRFYALLGLSGPNASTHMGTIYKHNWNEAVDYISQLGSIGMVNAKLMEVRQPILRAAMANAMQPMMPG
jgi:hypothetical protein